MHFAQELCRIEIDTKTEVLEVFSTFRYFGKDSALGRLEHALKGKLDKLFKVGK